MRRIGSRVADRRRRREAVVKIMTAILGVLVVATAPASAQRTWCWSFAGSGVSARGTIVTGNAADKDGFYRIVGITGRANSASVTALQPVGTSVSGNSGYPVDNLIRQTEPQLTKHGVGFLASDGTYHNPYHSGQYRDYISRRPYADGKGAEPTIKFKAVPAAAGSRCSTD